jgi:hypothetical protein
MKTVLSIRQPWAWLIVSGAKDIENRNWPTKFRGEFYVHASKYQPSDAELDQSEDDFNVTINHTDLQFGGIVGAAEVVDCVASHNSKWFVGEYGFVLRNARIVPFRSLPGRLGFFKVA